MKIEDRVQHLANLTFLLDYFDKHGARRNWLIVEEFEFHNRELLKELKEKYDAQTGSSKS